MTSLAFPLQQFRTTLFTQRFPRPLAAQRIFKQILCFHTLATSLLALCSRVALFSIACRLFLKNTRVGGTLHNRSFKTSHIQTPFPEAVCSCINAHPIADSHCASESLCLSFLFTLYFHNLTNCFSRNSLLFTTIRIARGCGGRNLPTALRSTRVCRSGKRNAGTWLLSPVSKHLSALPGRNLSTRSKEGLMLAA